jgi:hypothetical protein
MVFIAWPPALLFFFDSRPRPNSARGITLFGRGVQSSVFNVTEGFSFLSCFGLLSVFGVLAEVQKASPMQTTPKLITSKTGTVKKEREVFVG